ncbi:MAG TPA: terminase small subunit, partial [Flavipsychrobacter sp.]|nr:terminase small subunit [Flavipsychrobacter sp.]
MGLTDKQRRFCEEYLKDHKPNEAARRAGYRGKSAGWRLMKLGEVRAHMEELKAVKAGRYLDFLVEGLKEVVEDLTPALSTSGE